MASHRLMARLSITLVVLFTLQATLSLAHNSAFSSLLALNRPLQDPAIVSNPKLHPQLPWNEAPLVMMPIRASKPITRDPDPVKWIEYLPGITIYHYYDKPQSRENKTTSHTPSRHGVKGAKSAASSVQAIKPQVIQESPIDFSPTNETALINDRRFQNKKKLICYYGTWAVYRPDAGKYPVENIDPFLCTHVIYGFTGLSFDNMIKPLDPWNDLEDNYGKGAMKRFTNLKRLNPDLKTLVAIGGWNEGSIKYSKMASEPESRAKFVASVVNFLQKFNFDGLDLDWEYPGSRGGNAMDKQNFVKLLAELKSAFKPHDYLLTAAVSAGKWFIEPAYDIPQVSKYLDLINLMAYDYHGGWETKTGVNAPLFHSPKWDSKGEEALLNVNWSVNYWLRNGAPADKLMLGVGSYGRSFTLDKPEVNGVNAPASQKGQAGPYTREPGSLGYNEICENFQRQPNAWTIVRDADYMTPYAYSGRQWVGYDDRESIALKAQYAKTMGLGGVMMWSIETDDFHGHCHGEKYPLLNTIKRVLNDRPGVVIEPQGGNKPKPKPSSTTPKPPHPSSTTTRSPDREVEGDSNKPRPDTSSSTTKKPQRPLPARTTKAPRRKPSSTRKPVTSSTSTSTTTTSTTTSTTSTTQRPITSSPKKEFTCQADGMFADPANCKKFIRCVSQAGTHFTMYRFDCAPGTAFNEQLQLCDHIYNVPSCRGQQANLRPIWSPFPWN